ncbi:hypothetical protein B0H11DRAFT_2230143 [Mycena galericulata]|nr:hypothetical protein B0H11DRAFT_2230143 [Mycena galericulata]
MPPSQDRRHALWTVCDSPPIFLETPPSRHGPESALGRPFFSSSSTFPPQVLVIHSLPRIPCLPDSFRIVSSHTIHPYSLIILRSTLAYPSILLPPSSPSASASASLSRAPSFLIHVRLRLPAFFSSQAADDGGRGRRDEGYTTGEKEELDAAAAGGGRLMRGWRRSPGAVPVRRSSPMYLEAVLWNAPALAGARTCVAWWKDSVEGLCSVAIRIDFSSSWIPAPPPESAFFHLHPVREESMHPRFTTPDAASVSQSRPICLSPHRYELSRTPILHYGAISSDLYPNPPADTPLSVLGAQRRRHVQTPPTHRPLVSLRVNSSGVRLASNPPLHSRHIHLPHLPRLPPLSVQRRTRIVSFDAFPLKLHSAEAQLRETLMQRVKKWIEITGLHHMQYSGAGSQH